MRSRWLKEKLRKPKIERFQKLKIKRNWGRIWKNICTWFKDLKLKSPISIVYIFKEPTPPVKKKNSCLCITEELGKISRSLKKTKIILRACKMVQFGGIFSFKRKRKWISHLLVVMNRNEDSIFRMTMQCPCVWAVTVLVWPEVPRASSDVPVCVHVQSC